LDLLESVDNHHTHINIALILLQKGHISSKEADHRQGLESLTCDKRRRECLWGSQYHGYPQESTEETHFRKKNILTPKMGWIYHFFAMVYGLFEEEQEQGEDLGWLHA